ncbi:MAG TPA: branched-chain amino acid ABC transporter permease [Acidimicrobiales bacterium]|nr:branched-chain amino acid ABC transporter permease [Acidimicrobiales bacterium]
MSAATQLYLATLGTYICVNVIASWALDLQFGVTGVLNFCFIIFQSAGAYTAAVLSLGPASTSSGFQQYIVGLHLPFPVPILGAMVVGGVLAGVVGLISLRRLRSDYQAMVMLVVSVIATTVVSAQVGLFNGPAGISLVTNPMVSLIHASRQTQIWVFVAFCVACMIVVGFIMYALVYSPYGRVLRAVRENDRAIEALGRNANRHRMQVFIIGGVLAGLSGALLVEFIGAWAPNGWFYPETFVFFTAVIVGGRGSLLGVAIGAAVVGVGVQQAVEYLPITLNPSVIASLEWIITGALTLTFLWIRPQGMFPERRRRFPVPGRAAPPDFSEELSPVREAFDV